MLRIVTDGSIDLPVGWMEQFQIDVLYQEVHFKSGMNIEKFDLNQNNFFDVVKEKKVMPQTSFSSPEEIKKFYRHVAERGDHILSIHLSEKLSGTFAAFQRAADELKNEINIHLFDSGAGSAGLGYMCREARILADSGCSIQEIMQRLDDIRKKLVIVFTLDTLEYAYFSGRINKIQTAVASMLKIKPIIILKDGLLEMKEKVRTRPMALQRIVSYASQQVGEKLANVAVVHARDESTAQWLAEQLRSIINCKEIITTELSIPVAAHMGPGTVGIVIYPTN